jgi:hypothetical protein
VPYMSALLGTRSALLVNTDQFRMSHLGHSRQFGWDALRQLHR